MARKNRIVVDYGEFEGLVLLGKINTLSGTECPLTTIRRYYESNGFHVVRQYNSTLSPMELKQLNLPNHEGFVVLFSDGLRIKVKFEEYVRLHKIVTGVSNLVIWKHLKDKEPFDELLDRVPDEFFHWVAGTIKELEQQARKIYSDCRTVYKELPTRRETAEYFKTQKYPDILFLMLDGKDTHEAIYKKIKPIFSRPYNQINADSNDNYGTPCKW